MIILPLSFCTTKYPGYFYNYGNKQLYSIKSGTLRPVKIKQAWKNQPEQYRVSVDGNRLIVPNSYLESLSPKEVQVLPYVKN